MVINPAYAPGFFFGENISMVSTSTDRADGLSSSTAMKGPVRCATTANIVLSGLQTIDGVTLAAGDRVLVKNQTNAIDNGIWIAAVGAWSRARDFSLSRDIRKGTSINVTDGTTNGGAWWTCSTENPITIEVSSLSFSQLFGDQVAAAQAAADAAAALISDGDKGDITVSDSGATWSTKKASTDEALAGTDSAKVMTAARVKESVTADIAAMRSRLPVIDVTPSFDPASPVDITSTIVSYLDNYGACVLPPGEWLTTSTVELKSRSLTGLNAASTTLRGNISSEWLPVIRAGRNCRIAEMTLRYIDAQVTAANTAAGSRVLIDTVGAASGDNPMQRPSSIERVVFGRCGTGFSDRGEALFSVSLRDLEFYDYARAGVDMWGSFNTGCVWSNIYIGASQFTPVVGFSSVGFRSEDSIDQLNIEHSIFSDTALKLERQNNLHIGTLHIEGAGLSTTQKGLVTVSNSIVTIDSANFFFTRLPQAASSLFSLGYTGYYDGVVDSTVGFRLGYLKIGGLTAYGVGQPDTTLYPGQSANLTSSFNFFYRDAGTDRFLVDIDRYDYRTYNTDATTVSRHQTMASDPNSSIHFVKKSAICRSYPTASLPSGGLTMTGQTAFDETTGALKVYNNSGAWVPIPSYLSGSATFDPASLADGAGTTTTVTVTGAALGDFALASFSLATSGILITAWVSAADTVSVRFQNESGGTLDIASGTLRAIVLK